MKNDNDFIDYVKRMDLSDKANKALVNNIYSDRIINEQEAKLLFKAFNFENQVQFEDFIKQQAYSIEAIAQKYNLRDKSKVDLDNILTEAISAIFDNVAGRAAIDDCSRRYRNELTVIAGVAIGAHLACGAADLTIILGIICHGAAYAAQIAANDNAYLDYQKCKANQH